MKTRNGFLTALVLMVTVAITGCAPNYVPYYVTGKVETLASVRKQDELNHYLRAFQARRAEFERELDDFYTDSLRQSQEAGVLDAEGVMYLNDKERFLRQQFDRNEQAEMDKLERNLTFYDDIIELQGMTLESIEAAQRQNAAAFEDFAKAVAAFAEKEAEAAAIRRREQLIREMQNPPPAEEEFIEEPAEESVEVPDYNPGTDVPADPPAPVAPLRR